MTVSLAKPQVLLMDEIKLAKDLEKKLSNQYDFIVSTFLSGHSMRTCSCLDDVQPLTSKSRAEFLEDCRTKYSSAVGLYRHFKGPSTKVCRSVLMGT
jgi:hypothetical protein